jgi:hypothetical protein
VTPAQADLPGTAPVVHFGISQLRISQLRISLAAAGAVHGSNHDAGSLI